GTGFHPATRAKWIRMPSPSLRRRTRSASASPRRATCTMSTVLYHSIARARSSTKTVTWCGSRARSLQAFHSGIHHGNVKHSYVSYCADRAMSTERRGGEQYVVLLEHFHDSVHNIVDLLECDRRRLFR